MNTSSLWVWSQACVPYSTALAQQQLLMQERQENPHLPDVLMLLEHPPVYTLGRGASHQFVKFDLHSPPAELHRIGRGGEVTYHCPGQLVGYPILNLRRHQPDLHWYLRALEEVLIRAIANVDLIGYRVPGLTGVWLQEHKVAAIGIQVKRWITQHGFALNVCPDLAGFKEIVPCGIQDRPTGSLAQFRPGLTRAQLQPMIIEQFSLTFGLNWVAYEPDPALLQQVSQQ
ncbi:MAG: lipoyl(octanoyl) transferase LipB [Cyanobacteria bacterium P01_H01_bin.15]